MLFSSFLQIIFYNFSRIKAFIDCNLLKNRAGHMKDLANPLK